MGRKIGVKIRIAGVMSMNIPTTSRIAFIISNRRALLSVQLTSAALIPCGTFSEARTQAIAMLVPISRNTTEVMIPHCSRIRGRSRIFTSR